MLPINHPGWCVYWRICTVNRPYISPSKWMYQLVKWMWSWLTFIHGLKRLSHIAAQTFQVSKFGFHDVSFINGHIVFIFSVIKHLF